MFSLNWKQFIGKTKTRSQMAEIRTEDGRMPDLEYPVLKGCMADDAQCAGYLIDPDNQFYDEESKHWYQLLGERSTIPISPIHPSTIKSLQEVINGIFHDSWILDLITMRREEAAAKRQTWLLVILGTPVVAAGLVFAVTVL